MEAYTAVSAVAADVRHKPVKVCMALTDMLAPVVVLAE